MIIRSGSGSEFGLAGVVGSAAGETANAEVDFLPCEDEVASGFGPAGGDGWNEAAGCCFCDESDWLPFVLGMTTSGEPAPACASREAHTSAAPG